MQGGWVSPDSATPTYSDFLLSIKLGLDFLEAEFKVPPPKVAWQLDSFGHTSSEARLLEEIGYEMLVIARLNETMKEEMDKSGDR